METERSTAAPECINLRRQFGRKYRVEYEESYYAEYGPHARVEDPVYMVLVCKHGDIYPAGGTLLAASVDGHPIVANRLRRPPCCRVHQDGDFGELTVLFEVEDFPAVAEIMHPRRRRRLSPEARRAAGERLRKYRFGNAVGSQETARSCNPRPSGDLEPTKRRSVQSGPPGRGPGVGPSTRHVAEAPKDREAQTGQGVEGHEGPAYHGRGVRADAGQGARRRVGQAEAG